MKEEKTERRTIREIYHEHFEYIRVLCIVNIRLAIHSMINSNLQFGFHWKSISIIEELLRRGKRSR